MERIYIICMIIGIGIPLISLILGGISDIIGGIFDGLFGVFDGFHADFDLNIHIGDLSICLLPISLPSICGGLLIYGAGGLMFYNGHNLVGANIGAGILGYIAAIIIQALISKLRHTQNTTYAKEQLVMSEARVVNTIIAGGYGSISITTLDGITVTFPAKAEDSQLLIKQNAVVSIVQFNKNTAIVRLKELMDYSDIQK